MKKVLSLILMFLISSILYASVDTYVYTSISHETYRADYIGSHYNFTNNETTDKTSNCFSIEFGYKEQFKDKILYGISYGHSYIFFDNGFLIQFPLMLDVYYQYNWIYSSVSFGTLITDNVGSITTVPLIELGIGLDIPIYDFSLGLKSSVSCGIFPFESNISDFTMITKIKPLEIMFMFKQ